MIAEQYPFEPLQYLPKTLRLTFEEGIALLQEAGVEVRGGQGAGEGGGPGGRGGAEGLPSARLGCLLWGDPAFRPAPSRLPPAAHA